MRGAVLGLLVQLGDIVRLGSVGCRLNDVIQFLSVAHTVPQLVLKVEHELLHTNVFVNSKVGHCFCYLFIK